MRRPVLLVSLLLALLAAGFGLREGLRVARLTPADVIERVAALHVARTPGARPADCLARPGADVWIEVICAAPEGAAQAYQVNRLGWMVSSGPWSGNEGLNS